MSKRRNKSEFNYEMNSNFFKSDLDISKEKIDSSVEESKNDIVLKDNLWNKSFNFEKENEKHKNLFENKRKFSYVIFFLNIFFIYSFILETRIYDLDIMEKSFNDFFNNVRTDLKKNEIDNINKSIIYFIELIDKMNEISKENNKKYEYILSSLSNFNINYNFQKERLFMGFNILNAIRIKINNKILDNLDEYETIDYFLKGNYEINEWDKIKINLIKTVTNYDLNIENPINLFEYEFLFYNINLETSYYLKVTNSEDEDNDFKGIESKQLFLPKLSYFSGTYSLEKYFLFAFKIIFIFYLLYLLYNLFTVTFKKYLIDIFSKKTLNLKLREFFYIGYIIVVIIYYVFYFQLVSNNYEFKFIINNMIEFENILEYANFQDKIFLYRLIITVFTIFILIEMIKIKFYQYLKILFFSLYKIKTNLLVFFITVGFILLTFFSFGNMVLQRYEREFGTISSTLEIMLLSIFQNYQITTNSITEHKKENVLVSLFFIFIFIMINTLCLQFFLGLIISKYTNLKNKYQKILESVVILNNLKQKDMLNKIYSILTFKPYSKNYETIENIINENKEINIFDKNYLNIKEEEEIEDIKNEINENRLKDILYQNFTSLDIFGKLNDREIGRDDYLDSIRKFKEQIKINKNKLIIDSIRELKENSVIKSLKFFLYIFYIFMFSIILINHWRIYDRYQYYKSYNNIFNNEQILVNNTIPFKYNEIINYEDLNKYIINFISNIRNNTDKNELKISPSSYIFNKKLILFGSKKLILEENIYEEKNNKFFYFLNKPKEHLFFYFFPKDVNYQNFDYISNKYNITIKNKFTNNYSLLLIDPIKLKSPNYYNNLINYFKDENFINLDTKEFYIEYFINNFNTKHFSYIKLEFSIDYSGKISPNVIIYSNINENFYTISNIFNFIVYLIWFLIFFILFILEFKKYYTSPYIKSFTMNNKNLEKKSKISKFLNKDIDELKNMFDFFYYLLIKIYLKIKQIVLTLYYFSYLRTLYFFQMISIILTLISFIFLGLLLVNSNKMDNLFRKIIYESNENFESFAIFDEFKYLIYYFDIYKMIQSFNGLFLIWGIFIYFSFSFKLSILFNTLKLAYNEIISYIFIYLIIVFGYGLSGFIIFGKFNDNFKTIFLSTLQMLLITIGAFNYNELKKNNSIITPIFIFSFLIFAVVIFLKMFIIILYSTYNEFVWNYEKKNENILKIFINTIKKLFKFIKKYIKNKKLNKKEDNDRKKSKIRIFINKIYKKIDNLIWKILKKIFYLLGKTINQGIGEVEVNYDYHLYKKLEIYCENNQNLIEKNRFKNIPFFNNYLLNIKNELDNKDNIDINKEIDSYLVWFNMLENFLLKSTNSNDNLNIIKEECMKNFCFENEFVFDNNEIKEILNDINGKNLENDNKNNDIFSFFLEKDLNTNFKDLEINIRTEIIKKFYKNFKRLIFKYLNEKYKSNEKSSFNISLKFKNDIFYSIELISLTKTKIIEELILDKIFMNNLNCNWFSIPIENRISIFYFKDKKFFKLKFILWNLIKFTKEKIEKMNSKKDKHQKNNNLDLGNFLNNPNIGKKKNIFNLDGILNNPNIREKNKTNINLFSLGKYQEINLNKIIENYKILINRDKNKKPIKNYYKSYIGFDSISKKNNTESLNLDNYRGKNEIYFSLLSFYDINFYVNLEKNSNILDKKINYLLKHTIIFKFEKLLLFLSMDFYERLELLILIKNDEELEFFSIFIIEEIITTDLTKFSIIPKYFDNLIKKIYNDLLLLSTQNLFLKMNEEKNKGNKTLFSQNNMENYIDFLESKITYYKNLENKVNEKIDQKIKLKNLEIKNNYNLENLLKISYIK